MAMMGAAVSRTGLKGGDLGFDTAFGGANLAMATSSGNVQNPPIGDGWSVAISNAPPSSPVTMMGNTVPDGPSGQQIIGYTDQYGNFRQSGNFTAAHIGGWCKTFKVGGRTVGSWKYTVRPPSVNNNMSPVTLLRPMPSIIPIKPGQVSSAQMGTLCQVSQWVSANPAMAVAVAVGIGMVLRKL